MDLNMVVLCGRLATAPELRAFDSGSRLLRFLVIVKAEAPRRRVDVIPVTLWDPPAELVEDPGEPGMRLWVTGAVQRRFWQTAEGRRSRLEIVARAITRVPSDDDLGSPGGPESPDRAAAPEDSCSVS